MRDESHTEAIMTVNTRTMFRMQQSHDALSPPTGKADRIRHMKRSGNGVRCLTESTSEQIDSLPE